MRILLVAPRFPRTESDRAGAELWRLAEGLAERGHGVRVLAPAWRGEAGPARLGAVEVQRVRYAAAEQEVLGYPEAAPTLLAQALHYPRLIAALTAAISAACRDAGVHLIHAHCWTTAGVAAHRAQRAGRPVVQTVHGADVALAGRFPGGHRLMASVLRSASLVTATASFLAADVARALGVGRERIPVTPMPLALQRTADPDAARAGVVYAGRLHRSRGVEDLFDALSQLRRQGLVLDCTVIGDGPERTNLKARALALGLKVHFTGDLEGEALSHHLRDKRVFVLPARTETLGLRVAEALTQGVPVVATRTGGVSDLLTDPQAGMLVPAGDPRELAAAIRTVHADDRYRVGAHRLGRHLAERLSPEAVAAGFEALYAQVRTTRTSRTDAALRAAP